MGMQFVSWRAPWLMSKPGGLFGPLSQSFCRSGRFRERVREQETKIGIGTETKGRRLSAGGKEQRNETFRRTEEGGVNGTRRPESPGHVSEYGLPKKTGQGRKTPAEETAGTRPSQPAPRNPSHPKAGPESTGPAPRPGRNRQASPFSPADPPAEADPQGRQKSCGHPPTSLPR